MRANDGILNEGQTSIPVEKELSERKDVIYMYNPTAFGRATTREYANKYEEYSEVKQKHSTSELLTIRTTLSEILLSSLVLGFAVGC